VHILRDPAPDAAHRFLATELAGLAQRRGHLVQAIGDCEVRYQGRAHSDLNRGERLVILKPDGTLLVHTAARSKPVNWQPPGAAFAVAVEEGRVVLTSHRTKPPELVRITFHAIALLLSAPLRDEAELALTGTEDDLQTVLFENPALVEEGFVPARRERGTARGYLDLDGRDAHGRRLVVEVKRTTAGVSEAQQLWRYVERMRGGDEAVRGILIAPRVADRARRLLDEHRLEWKELDVAALMPAVEQMRAGGQATLLRF
jgi:endonuclease